MKTQQLFRPVMLGMLALSMSVPALAQDAQNGEEAEKRVRINVAIDQNGEHTEINEEREIDTEADVDAILKELGIEVGSLNKGERVEINIRKSGSEGEEDIDINISSTEEGALVKSKAFLGVMLRQPNAEELTAANLPEEASGAYITEIIEGTKAAETELQAGDIITGIDGQPINSYDAAVEAIAAKNAGDNIEIAYVRGGEAKTLTATLGERKQRGRVVWTDEFDGSENEERFYRWNGEAADAPRVHRFKHHSSTNKAFLGVTPGTYSENGVGINIVDNTAASSMGLQDGDVVRSINGTPTPNFDVLSETLSKFNPGDEVTIEYERAGEAQTVTGQLQERPEPKMEHFEFNFNGDDFKWQGKAPCADMADKAFLGVTEGNQQEDEKGVALGRITSGSPAEEMGLQKGDVILSMNGSKVNDWGGLVDAIREAAPGEEMKIVYLRDGKKHKAKGALASKKDFVKVNNCAPKCANSFSWSNDGEVVDIEVVLEDALRELENSAELSEQEMEEIRRELENATREIERTVHIVISVDEVTPEEAEKFNKNTTETLPLENNLEVAEVSMYPNPSLGVVNLSFTLPERGNTTVQVFDKLGNTMFLETMNDFQGEYKNQIDLRDRAQGTYFVKVTQDGKTFTKKIIKQ